MALNKKVSKKVSVSANTNAPASAPVSASASSTPASSTPDLAALQTALTAIVELVTKLDGKVAELAGELDKTNEAVASVRADLDAALEDEDDDDEEDSCDEDDEDDEDDDDDEDDVTADDIDASKVFDQLMEFDSEAQHDILAEVASNLGRKRVATTAIKKDPEVAFELAKVLSTEEYGCDMEDFI